MHTHKNRRLVLITLVIIIAIIVGIVFFHNKKESSDSTSAGTDIPTANQPTTGSTVAKIHLIVFEDLKCVACKYYNNHIRPTIKTQLVDTGRADYTVVLLAFLKGSMPAGNAAYCIHQQSAPHFFEFIDYVYQHQPSEALDWATKPNMMQFASHIDGIDLNALSSCIDNQTFYPTLRQNRALLQKVNGGRIETPTLFVNGKKITLTPDTIDDLIH